MLLGLGDGGHICDTVYCSTKYNNTCDYWCIELLGKRKTFRNERQRTESISETAKEGVRKERPLETKDSTLKAFSVTAKEGVRKERLIRVTLIIR